MSSLISQDTDLMIWKIKYETDQEKVKFIRNLEQSECKLSILFIQVFWQNIKITVSSFSWMNTDKTSNFKEK